MAVAAFAVVALGTPASAQPYVGVKAFSSQGNGGDSALYSYNFNVFEDGPGVGYIYVPNQCGSDCTATGTGPTSTTDTLTAAKVSVLASSEGCCGVTLIGTASASANLATGAMSVTAYDTSYGENGEWPISASASYLQDTLTFNIPGAGPSTVTDITVAFQAAGSLAPFNIYGGGSLSNQVDFGNGSFNDEVETGYPVSSSAGGWVSDSVSANGLDFTGVIAVTGAEPTVGLFTYWVLDCGNGSTCGYDGKVSVTAPPGVTFTSGSGVFQTGAAPEPATWALMLTGFAVVGGALRTARRAIVPASAPL